MHPFHQLFGDPHYINLVRVWDKHGKDVFFVNPSLLFRIKSKGVFKLIWGYANVFGDFFLQPTQQPHIGEGDIDTLGSSCLQRTDRIQVGHISAAA